MILAFDAGNTETVTGLFESGRLVDHWRFVIWTDRTVDEMGLLLRGLLQQSGRGTESIRSAIVASVVPPLTPVLVDACARYLGTRAVVASPRTPLPIRLDVEEPLTVGADRIMNTLAVAKLYAEDAITVDLGTATTFDCITADGVFLGGVIAPGVQSSAETLVRNTAMLPRVNLQPPERVIGRRTDTCLQAGIFYATVEAVDGIVRRIKEEWRRPHARVVATGGLATLVGPHCATVDTIEPFLTLYGLDFALRHIEAARTDELRSAPANPTDTRPDSR